MKHFKLFLATALLLITFSSMAQTEGLFKFEEKGKYGYKNNNCTVVIPASYDYAEEFSNGLAIVSKKGKCGFIDNTGKVVIPLEYDDAGDFSNGLALVYKKGKFGYIDPTGKVVVPVEYEDIDEFSNGFAAVKKKDKWGFVDNAGKVVIPVEYEDVHDFSKEFAAVKKKGKWGYIDKTDKVVIPFEYDGAKSFKEGLAKVKKDYKWGSIDPTGKMVIPFEYGDDVFFSEGLAAVEKNGKWGYIDSTGKEIIPFEYDKAYPFNEGIAVVGQKQKLFQGKLFLKYWEICIDKTGKQFFTSLLTAYPRIMNWRNGLIWTAGLVWTIRDYNEKVVYSKVGDEGKVMTWVYQKGKYGYIDSQNKLVIPLIYDDAKNSFYDDNSTENYCSVKQGKKWGVINEKGEQVLPFVFDYPITGALDKEWTLMRIFKKGKCGIATKEGKIVLPPKYNFIEPFENGRAIVRNITTAEKVVNVKTSSSGNYITTETTSAIRNIDNEGLIDETGKEIIPIQKDHKLVKTADGTFELYKQQAYFWQAKDTRSFWKRDNSMKPYIFRTDYVPTCKYYDRNGNVVNK